MRERGGEGERERGGGEGEGGREGGRGYRKVNIYPHPPTFMQGFGE